MKSKIVITGLILLLVFSCKKEQNGNIDVTDNSTEGIKEKLSSLKGTWELVGFYNYKNNEVVDSFKMNPEFRQLKMYTDTKVMWCKHRPADSSEWFGYGTYIYNDSMLTETLDFGSTEMDLVIAENKEFTFELHLHGDKFQQIELDEDGYRIYSENYVRVE